MRKSTIGIAAAVLAAFTLVACGGDGGSEDEDQITEVIETAVTGTDPANCTELQTQEFVEQTHFEAGATAVQQCEQDTADTSDNPDSVEVSNVSVDGSSATADVAFTGGSFDGSTLSVALVKEGDQWKLDELTDIPDFDAEAFRQGFADQIAAAGDIAPQVRDCILQAFAQADDETLKSAFLSGDPEQLNSIFVQCIPS